MNCTPADRSVSLGRGTTLPHPGSRLHLWRRHHAQNSRYGHTRQAHRTSIAVAKRFCRTVDRINPARVCGPYRRLGRGAFALDLASLCQLSTSCRPITPSITMTSERTGHWTKMRRPFVLFSGSGQSRHRLSSAGFITATFGLRFSVHTPVSSR